MQRYEYLDKPMQIGSLENRLRPAKEISEGIKQECGCNFPVSMRLGLKPFVKDFEQATLTGEDEAGRTLEEGIQIAKLLESYGCDCLGPLCAASQ